MTRREEPNALATAPGQRAWTPPDPDAPIPVIVGDPFSCPIDGLRGRARLGRIAVELTARHCAILDLVGRHPLLPIADLAVVLRLGLPTTRRAVGELADWRLVRAVAADEVDEPAPGADPAELEPLESTRDGAELAAARLGLSVTQAVRWLGFAGGGPERPFGPRAELLGGLAHTLGAHAFFVGLARDLRRAAPHGDDVLLEWRSRSACRHGRLDPDGYGVVRRGGALHDFFLEYETGATSDDALRRKFLAYRAYRDAGGFTRDYPEGLNPRYLPERPRFPTVLIVAPDAETEERVGAAARACDQEGGERLAVLLTHVGLLAGGLAPWRRMR
jgi:hypothetical protein